MDRGPEAEATGVIAAGRRDRRLRFGLQLEAGPMGLHAPRRLLGGRPSLREIHSHPKLGRRRSRLLIAARSGRAEGIRATRDMTYAMFQRWENLLFAHWRVDPAGVAPKIPAGLTLDLWQGGAWIAVTPFEISRLRLRGLPPIPGASRFPELNVRTYVTTGGKPGVWFFSLDAGSPLAVFFARRLYHLPYFPARMACVKNGAAVSYRCDRDGPVAAGFLADYEPVGEAFQTAAGSIEEWLTGRYRLYARGDRSSRGNDTSMSCGAKAEIHRNTMAAARGSSCRRRRRHPISLLSTSASSGGAGGRSAWMASSAFFLS